mgnify:CR=1 FL=1
MQQAVVAVLELLFPEMLYKHWKERIITKVCQFASYAIFLERITSHLIRMAAGAKSCITGQQNYACNVVAVECSVMHSLLQSAMAIALFRI